MSRLSVAMVAPRRAQCGVADYTDHLLPELRRLVDVPHVVEAAQFTDAMGAVDIVHIQHQYFLFGGVAPWKNRFRAFADRLRAPAVMTVHEFVEPAGSPLARAAIRATNRAQFLHPALRRLLVHTAADRDRLLSAGVAPGRVNVVRHGVPAAPALPPRERARQELGVGDAFVVTLFGFLSSKKGHRLALDALSRLPSDVKLLLAGGRHPDDATEYVSTLEEHIETSGLSDRARITGYLSGESVATVMSATDLILAPFSQSSGSGSLALAFACGKPVLASDIAPHREIVADAPGALELFPSGDADALAAAILALRHDPARLALLAEGARCCAARHSYARMAEETVAVYRAALGETAAEAVGPAGARR